MDGRQQAVLLARRVVREERNDRGVGDPRLVLLVDRLDHFVGEERVADVGQVKPVEAEDAAGDEGGVELDPSEADSVEDVGEELVVLDDRDVSRSGDLADRGIDLVGPGDDRRRLGCGDHHSGRQRLAGVRKLRKHRGQLRRDAVAGREKRRRAESDERAGSQLADHSVAEVGDEEDRHPVRAENRLVRGRVDENRRHRRRERDEDGIRDRPGHHPRVRGSRNESIEDLRVARPERLDRRHHGRIRGEHAAENVIPADPDADECRVERERLMDGGRLSPQDELRGSGSLLRPGHGEQMTDPETGDAQVVVGALQHQVDRSSLLGGLRSDHERRNALKSELRADARLAHQGLLEADAARIRAADGNAHLPRDDSRVAPQLVRDHDRAVGDAGAERVAESDVAGEVRLASCRESGEGRGEDHRQDETAFDCILPRHSGGSFKRCIRR